jgi:type VI secretion system protein ImpH
MNAPLATLPGSPTPATRPGAETLDASRRERELQALFDDLERQPWAHDFFALMRRVDALRPDLPRTGLARRPSQEALRLGQVPEMDFAPAALSSFVRPAQGSPRLGVRFFGLLGPQGPMPLHVTEYVRERLRQHGDPTLTHFLDLFHHRLLTLFYNAWAQAQPTVHFDRPADDRYTAWLGSAAGLPPVGSGALSVTSLAHQAGLLSTRARHPEALCKVLRQFFGVGVSLRTHVGQWLDIQGADRSRLGHARNRLRQAQPAGLQGVEGATVFCKLRGNPYVELEHWLRRSCRTPTATGTASSSTTSWTCRCWPRT